MIFWGIFIALLSDMSSKIFSIFFSFQLHSKRDIPCSNYQMHTAHCARHITLCLKCNEPIPKRDFPEHQCSGPPEDSPAQPKPQPQPTPEKSSLAKKSDAGRRVSFSNSTCPAIASAASAPTTTDTASVPEPICQYCHLEFPNKNMSEHENYCGSRTEQWYVAHHLKEFFK